MLLPLMMAADGHSPIYLSSYIESQKARYIDALKAGQQRNDYLPMIGYLSNAIVASAEEVLKTRKSLGSLLQLWESTTEFREGAGASRALGKLLHYPVITVSCLAELLQISIPRANYAITQLKEAGIVTEKTGYRRNRVYTADAVLMILNRPFGQDPIVEALPRVLSD